MKNIFFCYIFFFILFLVPLSNIHGDFMNTIFLNQNQSILLPSFNTVSLLDSSIENIILSLYVLDIKSNDESPEIHLTINPFDPNTKQINDGLSRILKLKKNEYNDFVLPREIFEKIIATNKRLLVKLVGPNASLVFAGVNESTTDPKLTVVYSERTPIKEPSSPIIVNNNYNFQNISNSQINMKEGIITTQNSQDNFFSKIFWSLIIPILAGLILFYIFKIK